jgi:hypothetical protein
VSGTISNLDRYRKDLAALIVKGDDLKLAMEYACFPEEVKKQLFKALGKEESANRIKNLPSFEFKYQEWYSEAKVLIKQLLPDRLEDFVSHYEKPRTRKNIDNSNYVIADYLQGISQSDRFGKEIFGRSAAINQMRQQIAILRGLGQRFDSSLFDIRQLVQADLFDSELDAAKELAKNGFTRAAGAVAGVVLERHLAQVCGNHNVTTRKKPTISVLNDALKEASVIDVPQWRFIQLLGDIRNGCDHSNTKEPTATEVNELIEGANKVTKTIF